MSVSHWGLFPGWFECVSEPDGSVRIVAPPVAWRSVGFDDFCAMTQAYEERMRDRNALST